METKQESHTRLPETPQSHVVCVEWYRGGSDLRLDAITRRLRVREGPGPGCVRVEIAKGFVVRMPRAAAQQLAQELARWLEKNPADAVSL